MKYILFFLLIVGAFGCKFKVRTDILCPCTITAVSIHEKGYRITVKGQNLEGPNIIPNGFVFFSSKQHQLGDTIQ